MLLVKRYLQQFVSEKEADQFWEKISSQRDLLEILDHFHKTGQLQRLVERPSFSLSCLEEIISLFASTHAFYAEMGGISGYLEKIHSFLRKEPSQDASALWGYHAPSLLDITKEDPFVLEAIDWGVEALAFMGEIFPLGGAADRLHLVDEKTGLELPAAKLMFMGKTLLERLICDIQARELLYFDRFGVQITTPIAIMTSLEKDNHFHIYSLLEENHWFHRPKDSYRIFTQPLVPVVDQEGNWFFTDDLKPVMKPGGHGALWKIALQSGVFSWFQAQGKTKLLVRQINNPIAGLDYGLLAFMGIGWKQEKKFGFASCPRLVHSAEGMNVLIEKEIDGKKMVVLTNIEYCDFARFGLEDVPLEKEGLYSRFSSNTNLLFADIATLEKAIEKCPFPGLLVNVKKGSYLNCRKERQEAVFGRLESTMQNIADVFLEEKKETFALEQAFITYNQRHKTISTTKKAYYPGGNIQETPEACFYDYLLAARELLEKYCAVALPPQQSVHEMLSLGPEFSFLYHPALGPLYRIIAQKIQGGSFAFGASLELEIRDLFIQNLSLQGSLSIQATHLLGASQPQKPLIYSHNTGKCILRNVTIRNQGVDWRASCPYWKGNYQKKEGVSLLLHGASTCIIEDAELEGTHHFEVFDRETLRITGKTGQLLAVRSNK